MNRLKELEQKVSDMLKRAEHEFFARDSLRGAMSELSEQRERYQHLLEQRVELGDKDHRTIQLQDYLALRRMVEGCESTGHSAAEIWSALLGDHLDSPRLQLDGEGRVSGLALSELSLSRVSIPGTLTCLTTLVASNNELTQLVIPGRLTRLTDLWAHQNKLTQLVIPETLTSLTALVAYNNQLTQLVIPGTLKSLTVLWAQNNPNLVTLTIPDTVSPKTVDVSKCPTLSKTTRTEAERRGWTL